MAAPIYQNSKITYTNVILSWYLKTCKWKKLTYLIRRSLKCANSQCAIFSTEMNKIQRHVQELIQGLHFNCTFDTHHLMAVLNNINHNNLALWSLSAIITQLDLTEKISMGFHLGQPTILLVKQVKKPGGDTSIQNKILLVTSNS